MKQSGPYQPICTEVFKHHAVMKYVNGSKGNKVLAEEWGEFITAASLKCGLRNGKMESPLMSVKDSLIL